MWFNWSLISNSIVTRFKLFSGMIAINREDFVREYLNNIRNSTYHTRDSYKSDSDKPPADIWTNFFFFM